MGHPTRMHVQQMGSNVLQTGKDFTVVLPHLGASAVFSFLSTRDMLTCTQVCWRWRDRILDEENLTWEALARCKGWTDLTAGSWLDEYRRQTELNRNWCYGRCSVKAPRTRGNHRKPICGVVVDQVRKSSHRFVLFRENDVPDNIGHALFQIGRF